MWLAPINKPSVAAFLGILLLPAILSAASLRLEGERAWLTVDDMALAEVLQLFRQRGIEVFLDPSLSQHRISGTWVNARVDRLIARLAKPISSMLEWKLEKSPLGELFQLSSIRIFTEGKPSQLHPLASQERVLDVVQGENGVQYIRGEIMVGFSQTATIEDLQTLLSRLNGTVIEVIDPPGLYRIKLNEDISVEEAIRITREQGGVLAIEPNLAFNKIDNKNLSRSAVDHGVNLNLLPGETAIAVLDSGLDPTYLDYSFIRGAYNALDPGAEISDPTGHGTLTSLIAAGAITPLGGKGAESGVPALSIRSFDKNGVTSLDTLMRALEYATNSGVKFVSMSWGSMVNSHILETAVQFAVQKGMTLYAAAGNFMPPPETRQPAHSFTLPVTTRSSLLGV